MSEVPNLDYINNLSGGNDSFAQSLLGIMKRELPKEIETYKQHLGNDNLDGASEIVHKVIHKIKILGLVEGCRVAEKHRANLLKSNLSLQLEFERILTTMVLFIKNV